MKQHKNISIIVAIDENNAIGKDNELLCHIPGDLQRFKKITMGHPVVMGRNTFESLPGGRLQGRKNIVISDDKNDNFEGCEMAYSIEAAIEKMDDTGENFIIGGGSVYKQFLPLSNKLYLTIIHKKFDADTFFPKINYAEWDEIEREYNPANEKHDFAFSYVTYKAKQHEAV